MISVTRVYATESKRQEGRNFELTSVGGVFRAKETRLIATFKLELDSQISACLFPHVGAVGVGSLG